MIVFTTTTIRKYCEKEPLATNALLEWLKKTELADWSNLAQIKQTFNSVDYVGNDLYVFDIKGGNYRLIARIFFPKRTLYVVFIGNHREYDKLKITNL